MASGSRADNRGSMREGLSQRPNRRTLFSFLFTLFLLLSSLVMVFFVFRETRTLDQILQEIDGLQDMALQEVPELRVYDGALKKASSEIDYLRILKRGYAIKKEDLREQYLDVITQEALKELPGNENLWAYRVSLLLDMEDLASATIASEYLKSVKYLPLKGEILVHSLVKLRSGEATNKDSSIAEIVSNSPDSATTYVSLARLFDEPRFAFNAAILYMVSGNKSSALNLIRELKGEEWLNLSAAGLIAYDNRSWNLAVDFFDQQRILNKENATISTGVLQYLGDSYAYLEEYEKVIEVLTEARELVNSSFSGLKENFAATNSSFDADVFTRNLGSWELFYNLASAYHAVDQDSTAFEVLRQGRILFPHSSHLLLLLNSVAPADEREYAKSMLSEFIDSKSDPEPELTLALLIFDRSRDNQQKFSSELWQLFSRFPKYDQILRYLLWYFIGLNKTDDVNLALDRYQNIVLRQEEGVYLDFPNWAKEYMAINMALQRNLAVSREIFSDIIADQPNWHTYYNLANVEIYNADFAAGVRMLRQALGSTSELGNRITIYYRMIVLNQISGQNYFSVQELDEIEDILKSYISSNYKQNEGSVDEQFYAKLDSLILWYKINNDAIDLQEFQEENL